MNATVTQWFTGNPIKVGVWETRTPLQPLRIFQHWDGKMWGPCVDSAADAYVVRREKGFFQINEWRGLVDKI